MNYKSKFYTLATTSDTTLHTGSVNKQTMIRSCYLSNIAGADTQVNVYLEKSGSLGTKYYLIRSGYLPASASLQPVSEPVVVEEYDLLGCSAAEAGHVDVILSYVEIDK